MTTPNSLQTRQLLAALSVAMFLPCVGCDVDRDATASLCSNCAPSDSDSTGAEGSITPCGFVSSPVDIDATEAMQLGYQVDALSAAFAGGIDAPLRWVEDPLFAAGGGPATDYTEETRLTGTVTLTGYKLHSPSPDYCDGNTCTRDGVVVQQSECTPWLTADFDTALATADDSINVAASGAILVKPNTAEFTCNAGTDLQSVTGTLRLHPDEPASSYAGSFLVELRVKNGTVSGLLRPRLKSLVPPTITYSPLKAVFPSE